LVDLSCAMGRDSATDMDDLMLELINQYGSLMLIYFWIVIYIFQH
jgi:hypothetical protein